jgi:hypothetical protein
MDCLKVDWCGVQELVCSADEDREAVLAYRNALENALDAPAAAHPMEGYGPDNMSLAQVLHHV